MMIRTILAATVLSLMSGSAFGQALLRADITVNADIVTVGDMFDNAGAFADTALFRAPSPGTMGVVSRQDVENAAARIGFFGFDTAGVPGVRVSRAASLVDETLLTGLIEDDLERRGILAANMATETIFAAGFSPVTAGATDRPATLVSLRYVPGSARFTARFSIAGIAAPLDVEGTIDLLVQVPHLAMAVSAGTVLGPEHIVMQAVPVRLAGTAGYGTVEELVGKAVQRQSRAGMMLRSADVGVPQLISRNDMVTIYYRSGPMTLTVKGQALAGAADGETIQILNLMSNRVISARAIAPGAVELSTDPLETAGL